MHILSSKALRLLPLSLGLLMETRFSAFAQVVQDGTLPVNSIVNSSGNTTKITGGTTAGSNLFHSFAQFSVPTGGEVFFNNALGIENIISRVTGTSVSNIDGSIRSNGSANLFLLNPNGIIFGPDASLNIGGSFIGSTANSVQFADGSEFSAVNPQASSLLTVSVPVGLQYGANPGDIAIRGSGNNLFLNRTDLSVNRGSRPAGLQVNPEQTLALVGGNVTLEGGNLTAAAGRIELGSVGEAGIVTLTPTNPGWKLGYEGIRSFQDIRLSQAASLEASGYRGGNIQLQGRNVILSDASAILADTLGDGLGGSLTIRATDMVQVSGFSRPGVRPFISRISTDVAPKATGQGGDLVIDTGRLLVSDGAQISSGTFAAGDAGSMRITAQDLEITGGSPFGLVSGLFAPVSSAATGKGGNLIIAADRLQITDGGQIFTGTFGAGDAGDLTVRANLVEISGTSPNGVSSALLANVEPGATGDGGNLLIETDRLKISNGAQVGVSTFGNGNAGSLIVRAKDIEVTGATANSPSALAAVSVATGNGGNLLIETDRLLVANGGQITTGTAGVGNAGSLTVRASEFVELVGTTEFGRSGLFSSAIVGTGNGGNLTVATDRLIVRDGATISVSNFSSRNPNTPAGQGAAGNLNVQANSILLDNQAILTAEAAVGDRGNINLQADSVVLRRGSAITTNAQGTATGGNITISTDVLVAFENSDITANAKQSFGGRVIINAQGIFGTEFREQLTPDSDITASSELGAEFNGIVELNTPDVDPSRGLVKLPNTPATNTQVAAACRRTEGSQFIVTGREGLPQAPTQTIRDSAVWEDLRFATRGGEEARRNQEPGARSQEPGVAPTSSSPTSSPSLFAHSPASIPTISDTPSRIIEAQGWSVDANGQVMLVSHQPRSPHHQGWNQAVQCGGQVK
jgi:filamentous hemagglutinin family protein